MEFRDYIIIVGALLTIAVMAFFVGGLKVTEVKDESLFDSDAELVSCLSMTRLELEWTETNLSSFPADKKSFIVCEGIAVVDTNR